MGNFIAVVNKGCILQSHETSKLTETASEREGGGKEEREGWKERRREKVGYLLHAKSVMLVIMGMVVVGGGGRLSLIHI